MVVPRQAHARHTYELPPLAPKVWLAMRCRAQWHCAVVAVFLIPLGCQTPGLQGAAASLPDPGVSPVSSLSAAAFHTYAVIEGRVFCWGDDRCGPIRAEPSERGINRDHPYRPVPLSMPCSVRAVRAGTAMSCAVCRDDERVFCWSPAFLGRRGDRSMVQIMGWGNSRVRELGVSGMTGCVIVGERRRPWCWATISSRGDEAATVRAECASEHSLRSIAVFPTSACGRTRDGRTVWLATPFGEPPAPAESESPFSRCDASSVGRCEIEQDNRISCWTASTRWTVVLPARAVQIAPGGATADYCALDGFGAIHCWSLSDCALLAEHCTIEASPLPLELPAVSIAGGASHACAAHPSGAITCWGRNDRGQLGAPTQSVEGRTVVEWSGEALRLLGSPR